MNSTPRVQNGTFRKMYFSHHDLVFFIFSSLRSPAGKRRSCSIRDTHSRYKPATNLLTLQHCWLKRNKAGRNKSLRKQAQARRRGEGRSRKRNAPHLIRRVRAGAPCVYAGPRSFLWLDLARFVLQQHGYKAVSSKKKKERHGCIAKVLNWQFFLRESALSLARPRIFCQTSIRSL
jgi:hypothetical protein